MIVLSIGAVSAQDADDAIATTDDEVVLEDSEPTDSGTVSGGVDVVTENPWKNTGELSYDIPADAKTIKSADVYVNVFSVNRDDRNGVETNVTVITDNDQVSYYESLSYNAIEKNQTYVINENVTKSNLDYMLHYKITDQLAGLNGTNLLIKVNTTAMEGKATANNLGYIKLIGLVLTYDDGDDDIIKYWINDNQIWTSSNTTLTFDTTSLTDVLEMSLTNIALDSGEATYMLNGKFLTDPEYKSGSYYKYNKWDVTDYFSSSRRTEFIGIGAEGAYGVSHKQSLAVLVAKPGVVSASVSLKTERNGKVYSDTSIPIAYPGLSNKVTITVTTNKNGKYVVKLLADGVEVNSTEVYLTAGSKPVELIDNTIRPINDSSVYTGRSGTYDKVNYTVQLFLKDESLNNASIDAVLLYNGYFNKALYDQNSFEPFYEGVITGDIFIDVSDFVIKDSKDENTSGKYASGTNNRVDNWTVTLNEGSVIVNAFIYVPYTSITGDNINMLNATFNNKVLTPVAFIRDQSNAVGMGGYGVLVYDVTDCIISGYNLLSLNRTLSGGIYPSTLIYFTNITGSNVVKDVHISNCADLLGAYGNGDRQLKIDSTFNLVPSEVTKAEVYVFAAGTQPGRASVSINGVRDDNAFSTDVKNTVSFYEKDITGIMKDSNEISLILNNNMFTALQQIIVTSRVPVVNIVAPAKVTTVYGNNKNFVVTLIDEFGNLLAGTNVTMELNGGKTTSATDDKGQVTFTALGSLVPKTYVATLTYAGNSYSASSVKVNVVVNKLSTQIVPASATVTATYNVVKKLVITLKDANGKVLSGKYVNVKVGTISKNIKTDKYGKISVDVSSLVPKNYYTAVIKFAGDKCYKASNKNVKVVVNKAKPKLVTKNVKVKVKVKNKKVSVTLKDNKGKVLKNKQVTLKVKGKTYRATTNKKGVAIFKVKNLKKKGNYNANVIFAGDKYFKAITGKVKIVVKK